MMTEEDRLDEAEVTVVLPDRTIPAENHAFGSSESPSPQASLSHKFEVCMCHHRSSTEALSAGFSASILFISLFIF